MEITSFGVTDVGRRRERNEDSYLINTELNVYAVADGMGGHLGGGFASKFAVSTIEEVFSEIVRDPEMTLRSNIEVRPGDYKGYFKYAINVAGGRIYERSMRDPSLHGMGTTVVALFFRDGKAYIANVGDSRCYLIRGGRIKQLTEDHSLVGEQVKAGVISVGDAKNHKFRNIITRSVGFQEIVDVDVSARAVKTGDKFLLCTDGLTNMVTNEEMLGIIAEVSPRDACMTLVSNANVHGGDDNITVIIAEITAAGPESDTDEETIIKQEE